MGDSAPKGLDLVAGIILIIIVITVAISYYNKTKPMQKMANSNIDSINQSLTASSYGAYDGQTVSGSEVISAITTKASSQVVMHVTTLDKTTNNYSSPVYNITDTTKVGYIEESGSFKSTLNKNSNGSIIGITFIQQ